MKGIILAGGMGTRLYPSTLAIPKSCLALYNKPMIYYPLSILMLAQIKDILLICDPKYDSLYRELFKNSDKLGLNIEIEHQIKPNGIAEAFLIGEKFINNDSVCLVLGDNFLFGSELPDKLIHAKKSIDLNKGAHIFGFATNNPKSFGIATIKNDNVIKIEEKPKNSKSNWAIIGVYMYDNSVVNMTRKLVVSNRGELEITDLNQLFLNQNNLKISLLGRGFAWFDTGNHDDMLDASIFIRAVEKNQGFKISCIEEISINNNFTSIENIKMYLKSYRIENNDYFKYIQNLINN